MGGGDPGSMGISCPTSNFPISPPQGERGQLARICSNHQQRSKHLPEIKTLPKWNCSQFYEMDLFCQLRNCPMRCFEILNWEVYLEHRGLNRMKNILHDALHGKSNQTWNLSKILHDRIFGLKFLHNENAKNAKILAHNDWVSFNISNSEPFLIIVELYV